MNIVPPPLFSYQLLKPKYWSVWLAFGALAIIVNVLPYVVLRILGRSIGCVAMHLMKRRYKIALRNLQLCFPDYTDWQCKDVVRKTFNTREWRSSKLVSLGFGQTGELIA